MHRKERNPYETPLPANRTHQPESVVVSTLWIAPWKILSAGQTKNQRTCAVFGFLGATIQAGLFLSILAGGLGEPYKNLSKCILAAAQTIPFTLVFGGVLCCVIYLPLITTQKSWSRSMMLIPWALMLPFIPWLVCRFCLDINHPSYGIVNDDRPAWMTSQVVLLFGSTFVWIAIVVAMMTVVFTRSFAVHSRNG